jgi:hypothetical protein
VPMLLQVCSSSQTTQVASCVTPPCSSFWRCLGQAHRAAGPGQLPQQQLAQAQTAAATLLQAPGSSSSSSTASRHSHSSSSHPMRSSGNSSSTRVGQLHEPWCLHQLRLMPL